MIKIDEELKALIPPLTDEEYNQLEQNILKEGIREPIIVWPVDFNDGDYYEEFIVDGHNRHSIALKHNLNYNVAQKEFESREDVICWMIDNQLGRRNLEEYVRFELLKEKENALKIKGKEKQLKYLKQNRDTVSSKTDKTVEAHNTQQIIAKELNMSTGKKAQADIIYKKAPEKIKEKLRTGDISINKGYEITKAIEKMPVDKVDKFVEKIVEGERTVKEVVNEIKKEEFKANIEQQKKDIEEGVAILPDGKFEVISIDPPWNYGTKFDGVGRRVANPYPEMTQSELKELEIPSADNSVLFLWTTQKFIFDAKELLSYWGYEYRNIIVWDKEKIGMGDLFRMQCEFCLVGIKGKPVFDNDFTNRDIIRESRREHSRKPDAFFDMVDKLCIGRKLEYFSREKREGWEIFGNDTEKF